MACRCSCCSTSELERHRVRRFCHSKRFNLSTLLLREQSCGYQGWSISTSSSLNQPEYHVLSFCSSYHSISSISFASLYSTSLHSPFISQPLHLNPWSILPPSIPSPLPLRSFSCLPHSIFFFTASSSLQTSASSLLTSLFPYLNHCHPIRFTLSACFLLPHHPFTSPNPMLLRRIFTFPPPSPLNHHFFTFPLHHTPFSVQDPEVFNPDRWAPDHPEAEKLKELFYPFALGKRSCVGQNLAALEIKLILASVLRSFRFELVSQPGMDFFLTLKPTNTHMRVHKAEPSLYSKSNKAV